MQGFLNAPHSDNNKKCRDNLSPTSEKESIFWLNNLNWRCLHRFRATNIEAGQPCGLYNWYLLSLSLIKPLVTWGWWIGAAMRGILDIAHVRSQWKYIWRWVREELWMNARWRLILPKLTICCSSPVCVFGHLGHVWVSFDRIPQHSRISRAERNVAQYHHFAQGVVSVRGWR